MFLSDFSIFFDPFFDPLHFYLICFPFNNFFKDIQASAHVWLSNKKSITWEVLLILKPGG